ncbi:MAG: hypothetical protein ACOX83_09935 [Candidatus Spyradocola sp.]|jgi:hypothetical protein
MKTTRVLAGILLLTVLGLCLSACSAERPASASPSAEDVAPSQSPAPSETAEETEETVTLYADFSAGAEATDGLLQTQTATIPERTASALADALSAWTGLDFTLQAATLEGNALTVDWAADSTLVAGLDDREQKEDFHFLDADSLRWFMLDSLYRTLSENLEVESIFYTMDGGQELVLEGLAPVQAFPLGEPYQGSAYCFAQAQDQPAEESAEATAAPDSAPAVLECHEPLSGLISVKAEESESGYLYQSLTEDGLSNLFNACYPEVQGADESLEDYLAQIAQKVSGTEIRDLSFQASEAYTEQLGYPAYQVSWQTGGEEDTRLWDALLFQTGTHTYLYAFSTGADFAAGTEETQQKVFGGLYLSE